MPVASPVTAYTPEPFVGGLLPAGLPDALKACTETPAIGAPVLASLTVPVRVALRASVKSTPVVAVPAVTLTAVPIVA